MPLEGLVNGSSLYGGSLERQRDVNTSTEIVSTVYCVRTRCCTVFIDDLLHPSMFHVKFDATRRPCQWLVTVFFHGGSLERQRET